MAETGHAKNVEHFQQMIAYATAWGAPYNPAADHLKLPALQAKLAAVEASMGAVTAAVADAKGVINDRENEFDGLGRLVTRIVNYLDAAGGAENLVDDARSLKRKVDGRRAVALKDDPNTPEDERLNAISVSQRSYTQLVEHFTALIALIDGDPAYKPNEEDLKVPTLETYAGSLAAANAAVIEKLVAQSNARGARDAAMYGEDSGLVDLAQSVKKYVKAAFGTDSLQSNQIKGLEFTRPRGSVAVPV